MITYNEEKNIRRCLSSARRFVDDIIVVDSGSTDRTKAICKEYGAKVYDYKWVDDFSAARNYSLAKATGDWILLLDADEELQVKDLAGIKQYLLHTNSVAAPVRMLHFYGDKTADEQQVYFSAAPRLLRNDGITRFTGKIHEKLCLNDAKLGNIAESQRFTRILHYGYMASAFKNKINRNMPLILQEMKQQSGDPWLNYYLAAEYYRSGKLPEAYQQVNTAIAAFIAKEILPPALLYKLKYDLLLSAHRYDLAYQGIDKAIALYPDYVDLHFYKGLLQYQRQEYSQARDTLTYCLLLGEQNSEYLILAGSGSFFALYHIGLCHEKLGQPEQAAEAFRQAEALCPTLNTAKQRFETSL